MEHFLGQRECFLLGHPDQRDRHQEGGYLVIGDGTFRVTGNEKGDLLPVELRPVSLTTNDVDGSHGELQE